MKELMKELMRPLIYAIDFDGLLCEEEYPEIGAPREDVIAYVKSLRAAGHKLILWTCREGQSLQAAREWCHAHGLDFDAYNENLPERTAIYCNDCRKIGADIYIDDRNRLIENELPQKEVGTQFDYQPKEVAYQFENLPKKE